jgi:hypothetical protein
MEGCNHMNLESTTDRLRRMLQILALGGHVNEGILRQLEEVVRNEQVCQHEPA